MRRWLHVEGGREADGLIPNLTLIRRVLPAIPSFAATLYLGDVSKAVSLSEAERADEVVLIYDTTASPHIPISCFPSRWSYSVK